MKERVGAMLVGILLSAGLIFSFEVNTRDKQFVGFLMQAVALILSMVLY